MGSRPTSLTPGQARPAAHLPPGGLQPTNVIKLTPSQQRLAARLLAEREALEAAQASKPEASMFPKQDAFVESTGRFLAAQCSRRAGKSSGLARRFYRTMSTHPNSKCFYLALTFDSAKDILWPILLEMNEKHKWGCTFVENRATMYHPNGATLRLYGADMKNFIKRLKGQKSPGIAVDEAQDFGSHLQTLVDDVLTPMMVDYADSWLAITGTPGPVPTGYYFDVTHNKKFRYEVHEWTILDNPYIPNAEQFIADLILRKGWDDQSATLKREWRNQWVLDVEALWVRYKADVCHFEKLPEKVKRWEYILGIDVGFNDADAIAVLAWSREDPYTYLVEEVITRKQGLTALVKQIEALQAKYNITQMVIDQGGLGLKLAEEMRLVHHIPVEGADKHRKQENVEFLNDALRLGAFKAGKDTRFAQDSYLVQIDWDKSTPDRIVVKRKPHSDIIDAVLYAFKLSPAYNYRPPVPKPLVGSPEFLKEQERLHEQALIEQVKRQQQMAQQGPGQYGTWQKDTKGVPSWNKWN